MILIQYLNDPPKMVHRSTAGEMNTTFTSTYDGKTYAAAVEVTSPFKSPASTIDSAMERINEVVTYGHVKDRSVTIELPKVCEGTPLGTWYETQLKEKIKETMEIAEAPKSGMPLDAKSFYEGVKAVYVR